MVLADVLAGLYFSVLNIAAESGGDSVKGYAMPTTALEACVDILFSKSELANSNMAGSFAYQKLTTTR